MWGGTEYLIEKIISYRSYRYSRVPVESYPQELKKIYRKQTGRELHLDNPKTYNEKIQWMKLYDNTPLKTQLADKHLMKQYIADSVGEKYVVPLISVWENANDINFDKLPDKFVLKANHGCHMNVIVSDKSKLNKKKVRRKLNAWLKLNAEFMNGFELQYKNIPRRIIAEEYIESGQCGLEDYKVWCFEGRAYFVQHISDRCKGLKMAFYDMKWRKMPFTYSYPLNTRSVAKPKNFDEMIEVAEKLSKEFHHVRVDFYILPDESLKVGELTFTSAGGTCLWNPPEWDKKLGALIKLQIR